MSMQGKCLPKGGSSGLQIERRILATWLDQCTVFQDKTLDSFHSQDFSAVQLL